MTRELEWDRLNLISTDYNDKSEKGRNNRRMGKMKKREEEKGDKRNRETRGKGRQEEQGDKRKREKRGKMR